MTNPDIPHTDHYTTPTVTTADGKPIRRITYLEEDHRRLKRPSRTELLIMVDQLEMALEDAGRRSLAFGLVALLEAVILGIVLLTFIMERGA